MAERKSFTSLQPTVSGEFDINGTVFHLQPSIPGDVLLDFLAGSSNDDPAALAKTVRALIAAAIVPEEHETWVAFIRDPANNVDLNMLAEVAGYMAESLSGNARGKQQQPSTVG